MKKQTVPSIPKITAVLVLASLLALTAWWIWLRPVEESLPVQASVARVRSGNLALTANGEGTLEQTSLTIGFAIPGSLVEIAQPGQTVAAGELLAALDSQKADLNLQNAELAWEKLTSPAQLADLKIKEMEAQDAIADVQQKYNDVVLGPDVEYYKTLLAYAERDYWSTYYDLASARAKAAKSKRDAASLPGLRAKFAAAELALEEAKLDLEWALNYQPNANDILLAEGNLQAAQSLLVAQTSSFTALQDEESKLLSYNSMSSPEMLPLQSAWAELEQARLVLAASKLTAPFDGTVAQVNFQTGEQLSAHQAILTLVADAPFTVQFSLDESDIRLLSVGDPFTAALTAYPNLELPGVVTAISPAITGDAQITVWGEIQPNDLVVKLLPGMNIEVTVTLAESMDTLILPLQAIQRDENGQPFVNVVQLDGSFQATPVTLGLSDFANVEILGTLKAGDEVSLGVETE